MYVNIIKDKNRLRLFSHRIELECRIVETRTKNNEKIVGERKKEKDKGG